MNFIKDFFSKISRFFKETVQKTQDKFLIMELTNQRNERQAVLDNMYCIIGRAVTENNTLNLDHMILNAKQHALDVEELTKQIENITGIVYCRNCGNKIIEDEGFCAYCGEPVPTLETQQTPMPKPQPEPEEPPKPKRKPRAKPQEQSTPDSEPAQDAKPKRKPRAKPTLQPDADITPIPEPITVPSKTPNIRKCHVCGAVAEEENGKFCAECGAQLRN
jgi:rRNA maturation endonuclease Nob1